MNPLPRDPVRLSVLVPAKDEAPNLPELLAQCERALEPTGVLFEVVIVNDGSTDDSAEVLAGLGGRYPFLRVVTHRRQRGIADALRSATDVARGEICVFYPADLQYRPEDIPRLIQPILDGHADLVTGSKQGKYDKAFVSGIYNRLSRWLFGVRVEDLNSVKAWRREVLDGMRLRPDWHRYMVVIAATDGFRLASVPVPLYPRVAGTSKFNWRRIPVGALDLLSVWFLLRFGRKPMLFFGLSGAILFAIGLLAGIAALVIRFGFGVGFRPLLNLIETMVITGTLLFGFGFVGEMIAGLREEQRELDRQVQRLTPPGQD
ncbi:MAG: glycosyltransferase family 2 protein [Gemmatimonadota bacterium]|nr:glycosyltransferase family 2 protein [Gemmatimonadota bacterium]